ncbi:MAG: sn-glycerol-3-phosphate ABC transporter ATP-binding protein UgpC [Clostridiales bacterium]|nr:sn-glycerol-3-phosphate ABC transporter ATP-binding protein UgpC [Clostridiales bacterium]
MASVKLTNVKKIYGKNTVAVHDFNLDIADKEFIVFVGPSGCGKSTTLRMIAGLEDISDGTVEIDGKVVNDLQPKDRGIAMVFQNYALYPHLTVFENMAFSLRLKKVPNDEIYKRVTEAAEVLGITEYLTRRPRELSGGQRQRVAIGRAMVRDSKVFLMDEPLSNLDAKLRNQMRAEIILLRKKINTTFIYVTHDQTEAMTLGDRIVIMKDGFIMQVGSPTQVFEMPDNLFVAEFIGAPKMNTVRTRIEREGDEYFVYPFDVKMPISGEKGAALLEKDVQSQDIVLGVRPEHITLTNSKNPYAVPCQIRVKEMMGSEIHLHVTTSTEETLVIRVPTVDIAPHQLAALLPGVRIYIAFRSKVMHFFNAETERNLLVDDIPEETESVDMPIVSADEEQAPEVPEAASDVTEPTEAVSEEPAPAEEDQTESEEKL